jgi:hypothetical protein
MESYTVTAVCLESNLELPLTIEADGAETTDDIILTSYLNGVSVSACNDGYFQAFQDIRDQLLKKGYGLKCLGAKLNAVQSAMASATDKIYLVTPGKQALQKDLASIYDYANISEFPTSVEQNAFSQEWIESLR